MISSDLWKYEIKPKFLETLKYNTKNRQFKLYDLFSKALNFKVFFFNYGYSNSDHIISEHYDTKLDKLITCDKEAIVIYSFLSFSNPENLNEYSQDFRILEFADFYFLIEKRHQICDFSEVLKGVNNNNYPKEFIEIMIEKYNDLMKQINKYIIISDLIEKDNKLIERKKRIEYYKNKYKDDQFILDILN